VACPRRPLSWGTCPRRPVSWGTCPRRPVSWVTCPRRPVSWVTCPRRPLSRGSCPEETLSNKSYTDPFFFPSFCYQQLRQFGRFIDYILRDLVSTYWYLHSHYLKKSLKMSESISLIIGVIIAVLLKNMHYCSEISILF